MQNSEIAVYWFYVWVCITSGVEAVNPWSLKAEWFDSEFFFEKKNLFSFVCTCVSECTFVHVTAVPPEALGFVLKQPWPTWNSLWRPGWPPTHRDLGSSGSWVLGLKLCATWPALFFIIFNCEYVCISVRVNAVAHWDQWCLIPQEKELEVVVGCPMWVLRTQFWSPVSSKQP